MSNKLLVFNCSTDMAWASGLDHYTPPPMIQCLERELALLPIWWADDGDVVLVADIDEAVRFLDGVNTKLAGCCLPAKDVRFADWKGRLSDKTVKWNELKPLPWGWNKSLAHRLSRLGLDPNCIPSDDALDTMRRLSCRRFAVDYIHDLIENCHILSPTGDGMPFWGCLIGHDMGFVEKEQELVGKSQDLLVAGACIFKAPWSSSGKGNYVVKEMDGNSVRWAKSVIAKQGGLCVDRFYNKRLDFAMEFYVSGDGTCAFLGYSLFRADSLGRYAGNVVASQERIIESIFTSGADPMLIEWLVNYHQRHLPIWLGHDYEGVVGIDMLLAEQKGQICLHPCIEINLRMNMGVVALSLHRQGIPDFFLTPSDNPHFRARIHDGLFFIEKEIEAKC